MELDFFGISVLQIVGCLLFAIIGVGLVAIQTRRCHRYRWPIFATCIAAFLGTGLVGYMMFVPTPYTQPVDEWTRGGGQGGGVAGGSGQRNGQGGAGGKASRRAQSAGAASGPAGGDDGQGAANGTSSDSANVFADCPQCPQMVIVPAGENYIGSSTGENDAAANEFPRVPVRFSKRFAVSQFEITLSEFSYFASATNFEAVGGCNTDGVGGVKANYLRPGMPQRVDHPVTCLSVKDINKYLAWLSKVAGHTYRLLSEAEWEYVRRGGTAIAASRDENNDPHAGEGNIKEGDWLARTTPVGMFDANNFHLYDMNGNVSEWTTDCWQPHHRNRPNDGTALKGDADCNFRAVRGGSWDSKLRDVRPASRRKAEVDTRDWRIGFRVMRALDATLAQAGNVTP